MDVQIFFDGLFKTNKIFRKTVTKFSEEGTPLYLTEEERMYTPCDRTIMNIVKPQLRLWRMSDPKKLVFAQLYFVKTVISESYGMFSREMVEHPNVFYAAARAFLRLCEREDEEFRDILKMCIRCVLGYRCSIFRTPQFASAYIIRGTSLDNFIGDKIPRGYFSILLGVMMLPLDQDTWLRLPDDEVQQYKRFYPPNDPQNRGLELPKPLFDEADLWEFISSTTNILRLVKLVCRV